MDLFGVFAAFIDAPWLAALPALGFALVWQATRSRWACAAAAGWGAYCLYEMGIAARMLCSGECNIRVDLLLIAPLLVLLSVAPIVAAIRRAALR